MTVAGVMSGTSADGIDVALVRITPRASAELPRLKILGHKHFPYPSALRKAVLRAASPAPTTVPEIARLNWRLGQLYADAVEQTVVSLGKKPSLIGIHGQTIYHQSTPTRFLGTDVRATWQLGEMSLLAERMRLPVISDFRTADLAVGGQGAPLVPILDLCLFRSPTRNRVLLNLGGIANVSVIPAGGTPDQLVAFDTGPANMVIDALMHKLYNKRFDRNGKIASRGQAFTPVVEIILRDPYFSAPPPRSCGREQFGAPFANRLQALCTKAGASNPDIIATATELTACSIYDAYTRFCWPHLGQLAPLARSTELIIAGGGARNRTLTNRLHELFTPLGVKVLLADQVGIPAEAKEAVAFALLAWLSYHGLPGNVPSATGAHRPAVLGKMTCV